MRSSADVFENNVLRYCVVINTVSDSEISPHSHNYMVSSGLVLSQIFSNAVSDPIPDSLQSVTAYDSQAEMC